MGGQRLIRLIPSPIFVSHPYIHHGQTYGLKPHLRDHPAQRADLNLSRHAFVVHLQPWAMAARWRKRRNATLTIPESIHDWGSLKQTIPFLCGIRKNAIFTTKAFMEFVLPYCSKVGKRSHAGFSRGSISDRAQGGGEFLEASILQILHLSEMGTFCCPKQNGPLMNSFHNFPEKGLATEFTIFMTFAYHGQS